MFTLNVSGQEDAKKDSANYQKDFENFKQGIAKNFEAFKDKNDSIFITFLEGAWAEFDLFISEKGIKPKPEEQPMWDGEQGSEREITPMKEPEMEKEQPPKSHGPIQEIELPKETMGFPSTNLDFFGSEISVPKFSDESKHISKMTENAVATFYSNLAEDPIIQYSIPGYLSLSSTHKLNGWGLFQLLKTISSSYYTDRNSRTLFVWYALLKLGVDARIGLNEENVFLFVNTDTEIYNKSFITYDEINYFLLSIDDKPVSFSKIISYEGKYPGDTEPLSLMFSEAPELATVVYKRSIDNEGVQLKLEANNALIDFYSTYPNCLLEVYFSAALSSDAIDAMDQAVGDQLDGLNEVEKVNKLLSLIQYGFPYQLDEKQFGKERYLFAEEALFYPFTDCEDRSVLLAQLVRHFTDLPIIGLNFPEHVAIGVAFNEDIHGDFVYFEGGKYFVCDPTYIGAEVGVAMDEVKGKSPNVIQLVN